MTSYLDKAFTGLLPLPNLAGSFKGLWYNDATTRGDRLMILLMNDKEIDADAIPIGHTNEILPGVTLGRFGQILRVSNGSQQDVVIGLAGCSRVIEREPLTYRDDEDCISSGH